MTDKLEPFEGMAFYQPEAVGPLTRGSDGSLKVDGDAAQIVVQPTVILARDSTEARMLVGRKVAEEWFSKPGRVEVRVRPFRG